jgi:hypothetical protein
MRLDRIFALALIIALAGCASASFTKLARNQAVVTSSAAPACRTSGAVSVATQMAAISTIREGYQRFIVLGMGSQNNTRAVTTGPTYSTTTANVTGFGNSTYGTAHTTYGGAQTFITGSNDAEMHIVMLNSGDAGFQDGIDARQTLGPDWAETCRKRRNELPAVRQMPTVQNWRLPALTTAPARLRHFALVVFQTGNRAS